MDGPYIEGFRATPQPAYDAVAKEEAVDASGRVRPGYGKVVWQWSRGSEVIRDHSYYTRRPRSEREVGL